LIVAKGLVIEHRPEIVFGVGRERRRRGKTGGVPIQIAERAGGISRIEQDGIADPDDDAFEGEGADVWNTIERDGIECAHVRGRGEFAHQHGIGIGHVLFGAGIPVQIPEGCHALPHT
jgi:hypothetical protein